METIHNTLPFVCDLIQDLAAAKVQAWLFGGWAEELWGLCLPRLHCDVDLLYPADDFRLLDEWIGARDDIEHVEGKCFHHKRAVKVQQILVEFFLLEPDTGGYSTNYFGNKYQFKWPLDTLAQKQLEDGYKINLASVQALQEYRRQHRAIGHAYQAYTQDR